MSLLETRSLDLCIAGRQLIRRLDWQADTGEFWCVLGRNGAGKSSLLHGLSGLRPADGGQVLIDRRPLDHIALPELARLRGLMPQQSVDSFSCTVRDTLGIALTPWRLHGWSAAEDAHRIRNALVATGMESRIDDDITQLSGGERQRVAFAAMLVQAPALMLYDEPTAHQDVAQQLLLMRLMQGLSTRHAVVATCHDINLAARFASHVLLLGPDFHLAGPVAEVLDPDTLQRAFGCRFTRQGGVFLAD